MIPNLNWINIIILFGALQGITFTGILLFNRKHPGSKFLAVLMFALAYNSCETFNWSSGLNLHAFAYYTFTLVFTVGPSLYLYVHSLVYPEQKFSGTLILKHYSIFLFQFVFKTGLILYDTVITTFVIAPIIPTGNIEYWHAVISEPISVVVFVAYLIATNRLYKNFFSSNGFKHTEYNADVRSWAGALLIAMTVLAVLWPLTVLAPYFIQIPYDAHYYPIEIVLVFVIYWIAMRGYHKTQLIYRKQNSQSITNEKIQQYLELITLAMTRDKLFLDPELNLAKMSSHTGIPAKSISMVVNQSTGKTWNEFINEYRVQKVKEQLVKKENEHLTLTGIALECGFNSQATFQRAFKQCTGMSPSEYIANIKTN